MKRANTIGGLMVMAVALTVILGLTSVAPEEQNQLTLIEQLGKFLLFDSNLSNPTGQSCASCHSPETGYTGPDLSVNKTQVAYPGAMVNRAGNRKPPSAAYAGQSPVLHYDEEEEVWIGGMFWDGRATGWEMGDPLAEQAKGPFLNNLEQNGASEKMMVEKVAKSSYAKLFKKVWGADSLDSVEDAYTNIAKSIAAYERSSEVNPFSSKYDYYLRGEVELTAQEKLGHELFEDADKSKCAECHPSQLGENGESPLFTDFTYDNLGIPRNPDLAFYKMPANFNPAGATWVDLGLGDFLKTDGKPAAVYEKEMGKMKVPTLRNIDQRPHEDFIKAYGHNGYFKTLKDIVHFYNTRDVEVWAPPEVAANVNTEELGDLKLTEEEEDAIVAFLKTLTDGWTPGMDK